MKLSRFIRTPLLFFAAFLFLAIVAETFILNGGVRDQSMKQFTRTLNSKQRRVEKLMDKAALSMERFEADPTLSLFEEMNFCNELFEQKELSIMITDGEKPVYWSDHVVGFIEQVAKANNGLLQLPNGWFVHITQEQGSYTIHGLILIKYNYSFENIYLRNEFAHSFHLPDDFEILFYPTDNSAYPVYNKDNKLLFSIKPSGKLPYIYSDLLFPVLMYLVAGIFFFIFLFRINTHYFHKYAEIKLLLLLAFLIAIYSLMNLTGLPRSFYHLDLFSPRYFAFSSYWTSMGEFLVFSIFFFFWGINFFRAFDLSNKLKQLIVKRRMSLFVWLLQVGVLFVFIRYLMFTLIMNSSVSFAVFRIEEINGYSMLGFIALGLLFFTFFFFALRTTQVFRKVATRAEFFVTLTISTLILATLFQVIDQSGSLRMSAFFFIIIGSCYLVSLKGVMSHRLSMIVLFVLLFSLFSLINLIRFVEKHEKSVQELVALNLHGEHDPTAEIFMRDIDPKLKQDTILQNMMFAPYEGVEAYILRKYFGGYFRDYEIQVTVCESGDSLIIQPENYMQLCFPFFEETLDSFGIEIPGLNFKYIENLNGRITYLAKYEFTNEALNQPVNLYLELNSRLLSEGTGFPELLLPQNSFESRIKNSFSFAKYSQGALVDRSGEFLYALTSKAYKFTDRELVFKTWDHHEHCIYNVGNDNYIIVSRPSIRIYDYFISFPYIFVFFFILALIVNYATRPYLRLKNLQKSLRMRIQISIIGVVLSALLIVGTGTVYYSILQYRNNHQEDLIDKINSISVEMDMLMGDIEKFSFDVVDRLNFELIRISDIFWTDIFIYDLNGKLQASSRPEVFEKGLISRRMDNTAFSYLNTHQPTRFLHNEHVGSMEYLSAYVPLLNNVGVNIGYINLPYFTHQRKFRQEITTFILAFINIYVFLLLASILVAYFISARITEPLKLIRENLRHIQLGQNTKPLDYRSDDEIGDLVSEYNNKLLELEESAELLAKSHRDFAWREMAKQIAHEIKNPLTPMKLNIQFLQRSKPEESERYKTMMDKVTTTLIEQIDNLSNIATEFSNFAQIPKAQNVTFNLIKRLQETLGLYTNTGQFDLVSKFNANLNIEVFADKEQFSRAIINLLKNSIQAIPDDCKGQIEIDVKHTKKMATIIIADNGKGINDELKEKIFVPNFTTKSSGTGLGLAITRNIVENFNGNIWFESEVGVGTTFYVEIPVK